MKTPFLAGSYKSASSNVANDRCINLYPEFIETKQGQEAGALYRTPGMTLFSILSGNRLNMSGVYPIRAICKIDDNRALAVCGALLWVLSPDLGASLIGYTGTSADSLDTLYGPVQVVTNGVSALIVDGVAAYVTDFNHIIARPLDALGVKPSVAAYQDKFAIVNQTQGFPQRWYQSNLNDFTVFDSLNFSSKDSQPDPIVTMFDIHREVWLMGTEHTEVWINGGLPGFVFQRLQGVFIEAGCAAAQTPCRVGQGIMWLGRTNQGVGQVYLTDGGYVPRNVATHAVSTAINGYAKTSRIDDAFAYTYEDRGHIFYVITFPSANATWCFDLATGLWHERATWVNELGVLPSGFGLQYPLAENAYNRSPVTCSCYFGGRILVGTEGGRLGYLDNDEITELGNPVRWQRTWRALPSGQNNREPLRFNGLEIVMETGVNKALDPTTPYSMMLRWTDDGGHTYSNERQMTIGRLGETGLRVFTTRLGATDRRSGLDRVFELSGSDPFPPVLISAELDAEPA